MALDSYVIEWDYDPSFVHSSSPLASCTTYRYGSCVQSGDAIAITPPYQYIIQRLNTSEVYYVRVTARNQISLIVKATSDAEAYKWSGTEFAAPRNQAPSPPISVDLILSGKSDLQVLVGVPVSDGGKPITHYLFEWISADDYGNRSVPVNNLDVLRVGVYVYGISNLQTGSSYIVRVSAKNSMGYSVYTASPSSINIAESQRSHPLSLFLQPRPRILLLLPLKFHGRHLLAVLLMEDHLSFNT